MFNQKLVQLFGNKPQDCFCGFCDSGNNDEEEDKYYECAECERIVPYCFGAGDRWFDYCDDCAHFLENNLKNTNG